MMSFGVSNQMALFLLIEFFFKTFIIKWHRLVHICVFVNLSDKTTPLNLNKLNDVIIDRNKNIYIYFIG